MERTIRIHDNFLKSVQLRIFDFQGESCIGTFIIDDNQRDCKLVRGAYLYSNIIKITNDMDIPSVPFFSYLRRELIEIGERGEILECKMAMGMGPQSDVLCITDQNQPRLTKIRIRFGQRCNSNQIYTRWTNRLGVEKDQMEKYSSEAQALYENYKRRHLPLSIPDPRPPTLGVSHLENLGNPIDPNPRAAFPPTLGASYSEYLRNSIDPNPHAAFPPTLGVSHSEYLGNPIDPHAAFPPTLDSREHLRNRIQYRLSNPIPTLDSPTLDSRENLRNRIHYRLSHPTIPTDPQLAFGGGEISSEDRLESDSVFEPNDEDSIMNGNHQLRSPHGSKKF